MTLIIFLLFAIYGTVLSIFKRAGREQGAKLTLASVFAMLTVAVILGSTQENPGSVVAISTASANDQELNDFPDAEAKRKAAEAGIPRYEAYQLLHDTKAIAHYCDWGDQSYAISEERIRRFGEPYESGNEKIDQQAEEWEYERQEQLLEKFLSELGISSLEQSKLVSTGSWDFHCRAKESGHAILTLPDAENTSDEQADRVRDALTEHFSNQLGKATIWYDGVECSSHRLENIPIVICSLQNGAGDNQTFFATGHNTIQGHLIAPLAGKAREEIDFENRRLLNSTQSVRLAVFAGISFDIEKLRALAK